ncbi:MAG: hypothetical protein ACYTG0_14675, partial [Planctomycetota bacterium]
MEKILCAIPGVGQMEVYPFDRVFIFKEAGVRGMSIAEEGTRHQASHDEPIEVLVLQASILSNRPADRGQYLTRRERTLRETDDFECDASKKKIKPEDAQRFFIHGSPQGLILSHKRRLSETEKDEAHRLRRSRAGSQADDYAYFLGEPPKSRESELAAAVYNLFGRLLPDVTVMTTREVPRSGGREPLVMETRVFTEQFERARLQTLQRYDEEGLYFHYAHGLDLAREAPLLHQLQGAYFEYLDDRLEGQREQILRETLETEGFPHKAIEERLAYEREQRSLRQRRGESAAEAADDARRRAQRAKVVYVSFSSRLHDANQRTVSDDDGDGTDSQTALLGPEYTYTMILVADRDPEKSLAQLRAERNDLKLYCQMLMRQIWMDKYNEYRYLVKKSKSIGRSMFQFAHRAKGMLGDNPSAANQMDALFRDLEKLIAPCQSPVIQTEVRTGEQFLTELFGKPENADASGNEAVPKAADWFARETDRWLSEQTAFDAEALAVELLPSRLPRVRVSWCPTVVRDAYLNALKNACEATLSSAETAAGT